MHRPLPRIAETSSSEPAAPPATGARISRFRLLAEAVAAAGVLAGTARAARSLSSAERSLLARINTERLTHGLGTLRPSRLLAEVARAHDLDMARFGYFGHTSRDGAPYWRRIEQRYAPLRFYWAVGENLLSASPSIAPHAVVEAWLGSPEHRAVLLDPAWRDVGVAIVHVASAPGVYGHQPTTLVTADFGVRD